MIVLLAIHKNRSIILLNALYILLHLVTQTNELMPKEVSHLYVRMSPKLKQDFQAMCEESEIGMSDKVREIIANLVRNHKRQNGKGGKLDE